jgi:HK97 gp10 family phage protein
VDPVSEFDRYADDLRRAAEGLDEEAEAAVMRVARGALRVAQAKAPVATGTLRNDLHIVRRGSVVAVESSVPYAVFQEYGTSTMPPHPYIGPAFAQGAVNLVREVEGIRDEVAEVLG